MTEPNKAERFIRFLAGVLFLKTISTSGNETEEELGNIRTRKGRLTREQKLRAVDAAGNWIKL